MADWRMKGTYFKSCNCAPGCPCDFMSPPTHGECEGFIGMRVDEGNFEGVSLAGAKWCVAFHWPGPLHEGNGTLKPYFDPSVLPSSWTRSARSCPARRAAPGSRWSHRS